MRTFRKQGRRGRHSAAWRSVLSLLLLAVLVAAPVVKAACAIDHIGISTTEAAVTAAVAAHAASEPTSDPTPDEHDGCCLDEAQAITALDPTALFGGASLSSSGPDLAPTAYFVVSPSRLAPPVRARARAPAPYESIDRRYGRLLI